MTSSLSILFWVGLGSALGGMGRFGVTMWVQRQFPHEFPWGTWTVNVAGSFVIGMLAVLSNHEGHWMSHVHVQRFFIVGLLGGFTTFSSFSLQTLQLFQQGHAGMALINICASLISCILFVWVGANFSAKFLVR